MKSPELGNRAQRKVDNTNYYEITMRRNYFRIMSENYQLVYQSRRKCEIYRDTGVSKNKNSCSYLYTKVRFKIVFIAINIETNERQYKETY